jgi:hypothetical protein
MSMPERYVAYKLSTVTLFFQRNDETRALMRWQIENETKIRKIIKNSESQTFLDGDITLMTQRKVSSHSIIWELFTTARNIGISITCEEDIETITNCPDKSNSATYCKKREAVRDFGKIFQTRHNCNEWIRNSDRWWNAFTTRCHKNQRGGMCLL